MKDAIRYRGVLIRIEGRPVDEKKVSFSYHPWFLSFPNVFAVQIAFLITLFRNPPLWNHFQRLTFICTKLECPSLVGILSLGLKSIDLKRFGLVHLVTWSDFLCQTSWVNSQAA